jgi:acetolactate synthase-1/2/3 large subunit
MKVYEAIAHALAAEGVNTIFGVAGNGNLDLIVELTEHHRARFVATRHEQGAVAMADGYFRSTGKLGFCTVTQGPGLANTATALTTACRRKSALVLIAGRSPIENRHDIQRMDQERFCQALGAAYVKVRTPQTVLEDVAIAFRGVRLGEGPVVIEADIDLQHEPFSGDPAYESTALTTVRGQRTQPDPQLIATAAEMLANSSRPIILAGRGAILSGAEGAIVTLGDRLGAMLATTLQAKGAFGLLPNCIGICGGFATDVAEKLLGEADCILAIGASLNVWTTKYGHLFNQASVVQIDSNAAQIGATTPAALGIVSDARSAVIALDSALDTSSHSKSAEWLRKGQGLIRAHTKRQIIYESPDDGLNPAEVLASLDRLLPQDRLVVVDGGQCIAFSSLGLSVPDATSFLFSQDFGAIGLGLPMAIGAALARPDRRCIAAVGDGSMMMSLQELDTAVRAHIPLVVIVLNDSAYGGEIRQLEAQGKPYAAVLFEDRDFAGIAEGFGAKGVTIRDMRDIEAVLQAVAATDQPIVIDIKISRSIVHRFVEEFTTDAPWKR